jgi:hypothetical protein
MNALLSFLMLLFLLIAAVVLMASGSHDRDDHSY